MAHTGKKLTREKKWERVEVLWRQRTFKKKSDAMGEKSEVAVSPIILYPASLLFHLDT